VIDPKDGNRRALAWIAGAALIGLVYLLRGVLVSFFLAFLIAYALDPIVDRLERIKVPRSAAAPLVIVALIAGIITLLITGLPAVGEQFADASKRLPAQLESLHVRLDGMLWDQFHYRMPATASDLLARYGEQIKEAIPSASQLRSAAGDTIQSVFVVLGFLIVPVFAIYLLTDFNRMIDRGAVLVPRRWAPGVNKIVGEVHHTLGKYVRGQLICCLILAVLYGTALRIVGVRLAIPIGVLTGLLAFVPYVGLALGIALSMTMALLDWHGGGQLIAVLAVMGGVGLLDSMIITPRIVGGSVGLKPLEVLFTMAAAATLFGFLGVLLAVPLGAVLKILLRHATEAYMASGFYRQPPPHHALDGVTIHGDDRVSMPELRTPIPSLPPQLRDATETPAPPATSPPATSRSTEGAAHADSRPTSTE
jgi:predicted PurR-regulated permease PerM